MDQLLGVIPLVESGAQTERRKEFEVQDVDDSLHKGDLSGVDPETQTTKRMSDYEALQPSRNDRFKVMSAKKGHLPGTYGGQTQRSSVVSRGSKRKVTSVAGFTVMSRNSFIEKQQNTGGNESGIRFFDGKDVNIEGFEVRVDTTEYDFKGDLLQFIHSQAHYIEDLEQESYI